MSQQFGPKIRTDNLVLCLDSFSAKSYRGNPITNLAYNRSVEGHGSTWEAITSVPSSTSQTDNARFINFPKLHAQSNANSFTSANGKIFRNYVNNPALSDSATYNNNAGFRHTTAIDLPSGSDNGYVIISFWCYLVTGYTGYTNSGLGATYMQFGDSGGSSLGNGSRTTYVDGVSTSQANTFNADTGRWKFVQIRFTKIANTAKINNFYIYADRNTQGEMYIANLQIEDRSDSTFHQIPYVENTLSATDAWTDISGNGNHGTFINTSGSADNHFITGKSVWTPRNSGIDFNGTTDYINITNAVDMTSESTIIVWYNTDTVASTQVLYGPNSNGADNYLAINGTTNILYVFATEIADTNNFTLNGNTVVAGVWNQAVVTINGNTMKLYQNGVLVNSVTKSFVIGSWGGSARIGSRGVAGTVLFDGKIGKVLCYKKELSAAEILDDYRTTKGRYGL